MRTNNQVDTQNKSYAEAVNTNKTDDITLKAAKLGMKSTAPKIKGETDEPAKYNTAERIERRAVEETKRSSKKLPRGELMELNLL